MLLAAEAFPYLTTYMMRPYPRSGNLEKKKFIIIDLVEQDVLQRALLGFYQQDGGYIKDL